MAVPMESDEAPAAGTWPAHVDGEWTTDLLESLPDDGFRYEIIDGLLTVNPSPIPRHQRVVRILSRLFEVACPTDHEVFFAPLDWQPDNRTSLEPDILVVPKSAIGPINITGTPTVVVEVLSPTTARYDRMLKFSRYAEGGIAQYWIVDPVAARIDVFDLVGGEYRLAASGCGDDVVAITAPLTVEVTPNSLL